MAEMLDLSAAMSERGRGHGEGSFSEDPTRRKA